MLKKDLTNLDEEIRALEAIDYSPLYNEKLPAVTYGYIHAFKTIADSLKKKSFIHFTSGVLAGIWIGIAYIACVYAAYSFTNPSVQKLLIGGILPLVLSLIYFIGGSFLTAFMSLGYPMMNGVARYKDFFKTMAAVYAGNIVGSVVICFLLELANVFGDPEIAKFVVNNLGLKKLYVVGHQIGDNISLASPNTKWYSSIDAPMVAKTIMWVFFSAIVCNMLVSLSSQANKATKGNLIGSIIMFWILIFMFAISGYQHCVANWFVAGGLFFISVFHESIGTAANGGAIVPPLGICGLFILLNIIPAMLGNYFGAVIMGFLLAIFNTSYSKLLISEYRLKLLKEERGNLEEKTLETSDDNKKTNKN
ncbi:formate/nitrite transporter FocA (FNT family) [Entomoplasma freundtii]|uniref:Formate/nitrite transporter n=1 Tax=Entomoplasma freundtii TaxID=74700 RepID=A0A2K8NSU8_9MOLU|nr:formate/nitrite transporter family protein [Entomoplasma freundtii]ATZ16238.1 formate/nitrite transporter [Entomoplasma freundtii]TDY56861.1 formate/nitrite transporter FocA (FNT family) [Entomoplasma freundtii]